MESLGNFLWLVFGGLVIAVIYFIVGLLMCVTIVGIPFGLQLFKLGTYVLWPFGHELVNGPGEPGRITIVGIPWGLMHFKLALATIFTFGKEIR